MRCTLHKLISSGLIFSFRNTNIYTVTIIFHGSTLVIHFKIVRTCRVRLWVFEIYSLPGVQKQENEIPGPSMQTPPLWQRISSVLLHTAISISQCVPRMKIPLYTTNLSIHDSTLLIPFRCINYYTLLTKQSEMSDLNWAFGIL